MNIKSYTLKVVSGIGYLLRKKVAHFFSSGFISPESDNFIREITQELNISDNSIELYKMNTYSINMRGYHNAFVLPFMHSIFISEDFFNELTVQERRFLVGHELIHIKKKHPEKRLIFSVLTSLLSYYLLTAIPLLNDSKLIGALMGVLSVTIVMLVNNLIYRMQEREADTLAAVALGDQAIEGGILLCQRWEIVYPQYNNFAYRLLLHHPLHSERIAQLKSLKSQITT